jgi:putative transposase
VFTPRPQHLKAFPYLGPHRYHLRFSTDTRRPLFAQATVVDLVRDQLAHHASLEQFAVIAYCFMPDHLHLLVCGEEESSDCLRFITRFKQASGFWYAKRFGDRLWLRYGFERILRESEDTVVVARYILANPVRGGLVTTPRDYPFVGSFVYALDDLLADVAGKSSG